MRIRITINNTPTSLGKSFSLVIVVLLNVPLVFWKYKPGEHAY